MKPIPSPLVKFLARLLFKEAAFPSYLEKAGLYTV
jgi:hypothetical protein